MGTKQYGGLGEVLHTQLPGFVSRYRFFFNPIRYTSLGLAVIEAMMTGLPVVALATTEYVTMIRDGETGFINTDINYLIDKMRLLLSDKTLATQIGARGKEYAIKRFDINRFTAEWKQIFELAILKKENYEKENRIYK
jgi:glycosyltransferase involved in cell wall biosynthesis